MQKNQTRTKEKEKIMDGSDTGYGPQSHGNLVLHLLNSISAWANKHADWRLENSQKSTNCRGGIAPTLDLATDMVTPTCHV